MSKQLEIKEFLTLKETLALIDVRTPKEFEQAHIPEAYNIPLFSNDERAIVGKIYKKEGKEKAVFTGLNIVGKRLTQYIRKVQDITNSKEILLYCWRGGMRSSSLAWLLETIDFKSYTLKGGYQSYRRFLHNSLAKKSKIVILGGMTGSGKTEILIELQKLQEQVIDLENLANHKGSAFGSIGENKQPSTEQFENYIFEEWNKFDLSKPIWIEDESHLVGKDFISEELWKQMRIANVIKIEVPDEQRIKRLVKNYTVEDKEALINSIEKIRRKLGGQNAKIAITEVENNNFDKAVSIILEYYDKAYLYGLSKRKDENIHSIKLESENPKINAKKVKEYLDNKFE